MGAKWGRFAVAVLFAFFVLTGIAFAQGDDAADVCWVQTGKTLAVGESETERWDLSDGRSDCEYYSLICRFFADAGYRIYVEAYSSVFPLFVYLYDPFGDEVVDAWYWDDYDEAFEEWYSEVEAVLAHSGEYELDVVVDMALLDEYVGDVTVMIHELAAPPGAEDISAASVHAVRSVVDRLAELPTDCRITSPTLVELGERREERLELGPLAAVCDVVGVFYDVAGEAGQEVVIEARSRAWDVHLSLHDEIGAPVPEVEYVFDCVDCAEIVDEVFSRAGAVLPHTGTYRIGVIVDAGPSRTSVGDDFYSGHFSLEVRRADAP